MKWWTKGRKEKMERKAEKERSDKKKRKQIGDGSSKLCNNKINKNMKLKKNNKKAG